MGIIKLIFRNKNIESVWEHVFKQLILME